MCICGCGSAKSYRKLADLRLRNTSCSFSEFAVAELSLNLRCPALSSIDEQVAKIAKCSVFSTVDLKSAYYQVPLSVEDRPYTAFEAEGQLYRYTRLPFGVTHGVSFFQRIIDNIIAKYDLRDTYAYLDNITVCGKTMKDYDHNLKALFSAAKSENLTFNNSKCVFARTEIDLLGYRISHNLIQPDPERLLPLLDLPLPQKKLSSKESLVCFHTTLNGFLNSLPKYDP